MHEKKVQKLEKKYQIMLFFKLLLQLIQKKKHQ